MLRFWGVAEAKNLQQLLGIAMEQPQAGASSKQKNNPIFDNDPANSTPKKSRRLSTDMDRADDEGVFSSDVNFSSESSRRGGKSKKAAVRPSLISGKEMVERAARNRIGVTASLGVGTTENNSGTGKFVADISGVAGSVNAEIAEVGRELFVVPGSSYLYLPLIPTSFIFL